jgi:hypothetical protein
MGALSARTAGRIRQQVSSQLAGIALALLLVQQSAARNGARQPAD